MNLSLKTIKPSNAQRLIECVRYSQHHEKRKDINVELRADQDKSYHRSDNVIKCRSGQ